MGNSIRRIAKFRNGNFDLCRRSNMLRRQFFVDDQSINCIISDSLVKVFVIYNITESIKINEELLSKRMNLYIYILFLSKKLKRETFLSSQFRIITNRGIANN